LGERKNGIERKMKAMTDLCTQLWSNLFLIGKILFKKKINHQKFKNQVLLEVFGRHKFKNKNKIIKLLYLICNVQAKI
jgi:hypothetical protein